MQIEVGGLSIAFERAGRGPAVALAHGFVGDARSTWGSQIDALSDEFTVIAWDAPGAGGSTDPPEDFGMDAYADCLAGFLWALQIERAHLALIRWGSGARSIPPPPGARFVAHPRERVRRLARLARHGRGRSEAGTIAGGIAAHPRRVCCRDGTVDVLAVGRRRTRGSVPRQRPCIPSERLPGDGARQLHGPAPRAGRGRRTDAPAFRRPRCTRSSLDWRGDARRSAKVRTCCTHRTWPRQHCGGPGRRHPRTAPFRALG
jgi:pimeloyl-ACP methyl ester carboxylesterase